MATARRRKNGKARIDADITAGGMPAWVPGSSPRRTKPGARKGSLQSVALHRHSPDVLPT
jgi:hypothetical protein